MADRLRVPFAKPPARHRAPSHWQWRGKQPHMYDPLEAESHNYLRSALARINIVVALAAGGVLLQGLVGGEMPSRPTDSAAMPEEQRHLYVTKRYEACRITQVLTGVPENKMRIDWRLQPDQTVNQMAQMYLDRPGVTFGPAVPVVRMFNLDADGRPVISREIGRVNIDTNGRYNPDHFYAQLPRPHGHVRYALSVRNSVTVATAQGERETVYGEQQCAELVWHKPPGSDKYRWGYGPPHPALAALDRYVVVPDQGASSKGGS